MSDATESLAQHARAMAHVANDLRRLRGELFETKVELEAKVREIDCLQAEVRQLRDTYQTAWREAASNDRRTARNQALAWALAANSGVTP